MEYASIAGVIITIIALIVKVIIQSIQKKKLSYTSVDLTTAAKMIELAHEAEPTHFWSDFTGKVKIAYERGEFKESNQEFLKLLQKMNDRPEMINKIDKVAIETILGKTFKGFD